MPCRTLDLEITAGARKRARGDVEAPAPVPAFDQAAIDGYAARFDDVADAAQARPVRLNVVGDLSGFELAAGAADPGTCFSVAAGAPLPAAATSSYPPTPPTRAWAAVEVYQAPKRGSGPAQGGGGTGEGAVIARAGSYVTRRSWR